MNMNFKENMKKIRYGHLKSEKAVDRHLFLKSSIDDSVLQILATLQQRQELKSMNISRLINLFIMKSIHELGEMDTETAFNTISELNTQFMEL